MKKHEAFQFLVKRRSTNLERKVSRKEHYDKLLDKTLSMNSDETASVEIERLKLSTSGAILDQEQIETDDINRSPSSKRRGKTFIRVMIKGP